MKPLAICIAVLFVTMSTVGTVLSTSDVKTQVVAAPQHDADVLQLSNSISENIIISADQCSNRTVSYEPVVPVYTKTYILPAGSTVSVDAHPVDVKRMDNITLPASPIYLPPGFDNLDKNQEGYSNNEVYPESWFTYDAAGGIVNGEHVTILTVQLYPVRYVVGDVLTAHNFELTVSYEKPQQSLFTKDAYDLLIICQNVWEDALEPLTVHKESYGIRTKVVCIECILAGEYFEVQGRDDAEKLKYFVKDAIEEWGIKYVLLVGGRIPGVEERWYIPVRYSNVIWRDTDEVSYASDLYFADIYDGNYNFSSWDTDNNGVFSEWGRLDSKMKDDVDLYPDVYLGRWACRYKGELSIMIEKTIAYENSKTSKRIVLAGGDNFPEEGYEGELVCDKTLTYLPGFEGNKIYASQMDVTSSAMKKGLNAGAMFIHLHGHGSPIYWSTHKPENVINQKWEDGLKFYDLPLFFNKEYPIAVIGGCHTAMFNVSITIHPYTGGIPVPEGLSEWFARKINGGAIASLGYTAYPVATPGESGDLDGNGINEPDELESGYGFMQLEFFRAYGQEEKTHLGECWEFAISSYAQHFKIPATTWDLHTIQSFVLLGDPTLKIGGY